MLTFWIAAAILAAAAAALVLWRAGGRDLSVASPEAEVYRRHLAEQDELKARGLLGEAEWKAARAEAGRRLLSLDDSAPVEAEAAPPSRRDLRIVLAVLAGAVALAMAAYLVIGAPSAPDQPYAARLKAWRAADPAALDAPRAAAVLAQIAVERPSDPEVWSNLGLARVQAGDAIGAVRAFERALALRPGSADDWTALGVSLAQLNNGDPGPDGLRAFRRALEVDPDAPGPKFYLGKAEIDAGRRAEGLAIWRAAAASLDANDPRRRALEGDIRRVETGEDLRPPPSPAETVAAAPAAEQARMIRGMVDGLAARLEAEPDDPQGWARLVRAYVVLDEPARRDAALARARTLFKDRPADLAAIEAAAR